MSRLRTACSGLRAHLLALVLLALVPALGLIFYTAAEQRRHATDAAQDNALRLARLAAADYEQLISGTQPMLMTLAYLPAVRAGDATACGALLSQLLTQYPLYGNVGVLSRSGDLTCSARPTDRQVNLADQGYFQRALATQDFAVGDYQIERASGEATLNVGYPLRDVTGEPIGVVFAALRLTGLMQAMEAVQLPPNATLTLLDDDGTVLGRLPDTAPWLGAGVATTRLGATVLSEREGVGAVTDLDGTPRLFGFTPLDVGPQAGAIHVGIGLPYGAALAEADQLLVRSLVALGLVTVLALVAAWLAGHWIIVRRVQALVAAAKRLGAGDLSARVGEARGPAELAELAHTFDTMADALQARQCDVDRAAAQVLMLNATLEQRVEERTQQVVAAKELAERERATFAGVMASMSDGLILIDGTQRIRYCNARAGELMGLDVSELLGQTPQAALDLLGPRFVNPPAAHAAWYSALAQLDNRPSYELCLAGAPPRDLLLLLFPVADNVGGGRGTGVVLRDITAERTLERAKDELVSVVSHELRTPLASLVGFAELLLDRDYSEAQRRQFLTVMLQEGRRLTALINDFLDLQRIESGRQQLSPTPTDLRPLLTQSVDSVGDDPDRPIVLDLPEALPLALADPDRVQQVIANLLSNARKYSPAGGRVRLSADVSDGVIAVTVEDQGLGIPADALPRLFEKFYRVDNSDRRTIRGTGLGLAIVKQIVEAHGGRVWAESDGPGQGSRFRFTLPIAAASASRGDVLVVEDDPGFARLLEAELATRGYSTVRVPSAEAALAQLGSAQPRVVLLDLMLPGMQGEVFLRRLRGLVGMELPVVVVSVKDLDEAARQALLDNGVVAILRKGPGVAAAAGQAVREALKAPQAVLA
jgi:signal transduction histidine kinase